MLEFLEKRAESIPEHTKAKFGPLVLPRDRQCVVNRLPTELLSYIFKLGTFSDDEYDADDELPLAFEDALEGQMIAYIACNLKDALFHDICICKEDRKQLVFPVLVSHVSRQ